MKEIEKIQQIVSRETNISLETIKGNSRLQEHVFARHVSIWACKKNTICSLQEIAKEHSKNTHGTVINACKSIDAQIKYNKNVKDLCEKIKNVIKNQKL